MTIEETNAVEPLFLNSQHLLIAVVATIAAEHGITLTRELVDELAEDEATWDAIAQKLGVRADDGDEGQNGIDTEPPPPPDPDQAGSVEEYLSTPQVEPGQGPNAVEELLSSEGLESAGPDGTGPAVIETKEGDSILPPPMHEANGDANGNGTTRGRRGKKNAHA